VSTSLVEYELWSKGDWPRREVVGESFHPEEIRSLFPQTIPDGGQELLLSAQLTPDPGNAHDKNAVRVVVLGRHVGHLSREDAAVFQPVLMALVSRGMLPTTRCRVWGSEYDEWVGTDRRGRDITRPKFSSSVTLALDEWYLCVPINEPPAEPHTMLPRGSALQVRREENHQDHLRRYISRHGECWVYGTLHGVTEQTTRTTRELVEVRVDGQRVGDLTPAMSTEFLPAIARLAERGRATGVKLIVKGNQIKAEVVLHAMKAHQLPTEWVAEHLAQNVSPTSEPSTHPRQLPAHTFVPVAAEPSPSATRTTQTVVPPRPRITFRTPPGWPPAPIGWEPEPEWRPHPEWPPAPPNWEFWQVSR
jgi:hypothetical protein